MGLAVDPMHRVRYGKNNNPHLLTSMGSRVHGADYRIRTDDLSLTRRLHYHCAKSAYSLVIRLVRYPGVTVIGYAPQ